ADDAVADEARAAYDRGAAAYERGDFGAAVVELARADELVPNDVALEAALRAAIAADDPVLGTILLDRAAARAATAPSSSGLASIRDEARARFRGRTARLHVTCRTCVATLDGLPIAVGTDVVVRAGKRRLTVARGDVRTTRELELTPDAREIVVEHETKATSSARADTRPGDRGAARDPTRDTATLDPTRDAATLDPPRDTATLDPPRDAALIAQTPPRARATPWLLAGGGLTALLGGAALASGLDTRGRHADFVDAGCATLGGASCAGLASAGESAERRTNYLLGGAALSGLATAALWLAVELAADDPVPEDSIP
ncbi:hypothetical protein L6R52_43525, partial [Myxococcota bacterium]|nr:hypothetical protein [Myxococcota bacterium]